MIYYNLFPDGRFLISSLSYAEAQSYEIPDYDGTKRYFVDDGKLQSQDVEIFENVENQKSNSLSNLMRDALDLI